MNKSIKNFIDESRPDFFQFGRLFLCNICNEELIEKLTERDAEKVAKVFKLLLEIFEQGGEEEAPEALTAIISAFGEIGGDEAG